MHSQGMIPGAVHQVKLGLKHVYGSTVQQVNVCAAVQQLTADTDGWW